MNKSNFSDFLRRFKEAIFAAVMLIFFILVIYFTKDIRMLVVNTTVDARFWPKMIAIGGCILCVLLFIQSTIEGIALTKKEEAGLAEKPPKGERFFEGDRLRSLLTLVLMFLYILGLETFGFLAMTIVYLFLQFYLLADKKDPKIKRLIIVSVLFSVVVYLLFRFAFQMMLPTGTIWG